MRGEGPGFLAPEASASATSAAAESSDKGGQEPASLPPAPPFLPRHKTPFALCLGRSGSVGCPLAPGGRHATASPPVPPSPASSAPEPAAQMWSDPAAGAEPSAGTGGGQSCSGGSRAPHFPARIGFGVGTDHMKDARPQARADAKPCRPGAGAEVSCSHPIPRAAGHRLGRTQGPLRQGSPRTWLTSACSPASPWREERAPGVPGGRGLPLGCSPTGGSRSRHRGQRDMMGWNRPLQGTQIAPCSPTAGLG